jgi:hypothetical protein
MRYRKERPRIDKIEEFEIRRFSDFFDSCEEEA